MYVSISAMTDKEAINAPDPVGQYPLARKSGGLLFLSGVGPRLPADNEIPGNKYDETGKLLHYDIEQQCHSVFTNVRNILEGFGAGWHDLVDVTVFLTNMKTDFDTFNRVWAEWFPVDPPCRTTVEVRALPTPIAIELKCVARPGATEQ